MSSSGEELTEEDVMKMRVSELKTSLRKMGKDTSGLKAVLQKRLINAIEELDMIDGDTNLNDDELFDEVDDLDTFETTDGDLLDVDYGLDEVETEDTVDTQPIEKLENSNNRNVLVDFANEIDIENKSDTSINNDNSIISKPRNEMTDEERRKERGKRFGINVLSKKDRILMRKKRFANPNDNDFSIDSIEEPEERVRKRAKRFGVNPGGKIGENDFAMERRARMERFGMIEPQERIDKRKERFGTDTPLSVTAPKLGRSALLDKTLDQLSQQQRGRGRGRYRGRGRGRGRSWRGRGKARNGYEAVRGTDSAKLAARRARFS